MRNDRTQPCFTIALTILLLLCGSGVVLGQGGTGRAPTPSPSPKTKQPTKTSQPVKRRTTSSRGSRSTSSTSNTDNSSAPSTPATDTSSTSAAKETNESSATLSETINWLGTKLVDPTFLQWITIKDGYPNIPTPDSSRDEKYMPGSPSFAVDQCKLIVDHSIGFLSTVDNKSHNHGGKITIDFADVDPNSISPQDDQWLIGVILRTNTASIKFTSINPGEDFAGSVVKIALSSKEGLPSVMKAIKHAVKLCGGKTSQF